MADKPNYPQIPGTVWWGVRALLQRSPNISINERTLATELQVQEAAARQYLSELKRSGIVSEDSKSTPLAAKWRHDDTYSDAVEELLRNIYPEELIQLSPPNHMDRNKVVSWFTRAGFGSGTAGNKAATYLMIGSETPNDRSIRNSSLQKTNSRDPSARGRVKTEPMLVQAKQSAGPTRGAKGDVMPLNINLQIHISAEAGVDQIEAIFSAMRRYLHDEPVSE